MLKMVGLGGIVLTGAALGQIYCMSLEARFRQLRQVREALRALATEIDYARRPIPQAWKEIEEQLSYPVSRIFSLACDLFGPAGQVTPGKAWTRAVERTAPELALTSDDCRILQSLGAVLGTSHREDQLGHLRLVDEQLAARIARAEEDARKRGKLFRSLGILSGLLGAVLCL